MRSSLVENHGRAEPHSEKKSGRVDVRSKTNSQTSKPWQTLLTGPSVSQLSSKMPFKPFIFIYLFFYIFFLCTAFWVCFINPQRDKPRKRGKGERQNKSVTRRSVNMCRGLLEYYFQ